VDIEARSVTFLEWHIEKSFSEIMGREVIKTLEWIDVDDEGQEPHSRAVATTTTNRGRDTNTLILFPPFFPLDPNKDIAPADY